MNDEDNFMKWIGFEDSLVIDADVLGTDNFIQSDVGKAINARTRPFNEQKLMFISNASSIIEINHEQRIINKTH
ncbi:MAG: hypothetical protein MJA29_04400 [Candidatus Omnitrophica bacterium]|nr:hypothetical protein [Candidatus Omnitrophota bacterium]